MAFIIHKEVLKSGLIIFRRGGVEHRNFYCRIKLPKEDRYKTISLHTADRESARDRAFDQDADIRFRVKHYVAVFNRPFRQVAADYLQTQQRRADTSEVSHDRVKNLRNAFKKALEDYVGSTQIHLIGQDSRAGYPTWRRENGKGRFCEHISDATIQFEMGALNAVMNFAITKRLVPACHRFEGRPKLKTMRRDEFTIEEYRKLHSVGRKSIRAATTPQGTWYRTMCYNFTLILCNTGMRPLEAKNLPNVDRRTNEQAVAVARGQAGLPRFIVNGKTLWQQIRDAYNQAAGALDATGQSEDQALASEVRGFLYKHPDMNATPETFAARHAQSLRLDRPKPEPPIPQPSPRDRGRIR